MHTLTIEVRKIYIHIMLHADERIGVGGTISHPFNRAIREIVYLRLLMSGAIFLAAYQLLPAIEATIDSTLSTLVFPHA